MKNKYKILALFIGAMFIGQGVYMFTAHANPSIYAPTKETAPVTTTVVYMAPGTATTTLTYDSFNGDYSLIGNLTLAFQYTASSTEPHLNVRLEDSPNNIDWYPRAVAVNTNATTTLMAPVGVYNFDLATTTDNGGSGTSSRVNESFSVKAPMRYVRAIFYVPQGGGNGALWAQMVPSKQINGR